MIKIGTYIIKIGIFMTCCNIYRSFFRPTFWLPRERLQGTTSTPVVPVFFGRKISNVGGVNHRNKPAQRVPWRFLSLKKYKIVFFGPILVKL